jgi:CheY-like chemotaxis protein
VVARSVRLVYCSRRRLLIDCARRKVMNTTRPASTTVPAPRASGLPVLVIDDNDTEREIIIRYLGKAWPFESEMILDSAADGREALKKIRSNRYALIVLDWKMPHLEGGEVLRTIRHNGVRIPVVVLSGFPRHEIKENLDSLGAAFLNKDEMTPVSLHHAIATSLRLLGFMPVQPTR